MDAKLKRKWIKALRNGEFKQTHDTLCDESGYCCLGVLCKVAGLEIREDGGGIGNGSFESASYASYKPIFDLVGGYKLAHELSMRNDGLHDKRRWSFPEIANYIEQNL